MKFKILIVMLMLSIFNIAQCETLATIKTSGLLIKDKLIIQVFDDPTIKGVSCYVTTPKRALSFTDQTDSSISCRKTGAIVGNLSNKRKIFSEKKSLIFKHLFVDRVYDATRNVLVYVSYTEKLSGDNANNSISVVVVK